MESGIDKVREAKVAPTTLISFSRLPEVVGRLPEVVFSKSRKQKAESRRDEKSEGMGKILMRGKARKGADRWDRGFRIQNPTPPLAKAFKVRKGSEWFGKMRDAGTVKAARP